MFQHAINDTPAMPKMSRYTSTSTTTNMGTISENKQNGALKIEAKLDIVEPLGMETMVYFSINNSQICGKVSPDNTIKNGKVITLYLDSLNFHFIDPKTDIVL